MSIAANIDTYIYICHYTVHLQIVLYTYVLRFKGTYNINVFIQFTYTQYTLYIYNYNQTEKPAIKLMHTNIRVLIS